MSRLAFILAVSFGSLAAGYLLRNLGWVRESLLMRASGYAKIACLVFLLPIPVLISFWRLAGAPPQLAVFPLLGVLSIAVGAAGSLACIRLFRLPPARAGALLCCGMFSNLGLFGSLISLVLFGVPGYTMAQLFAMFEALIYFGVGFPLAQQLGAGAPGLRLDWRALRRNKPAFAPLAAVLLGGSLNLAGAPCPALLDGAIGFLVPFITGTLGLAIGVTVRLARVRDYLPEVGMVMAVKFALIPAVLLPLGLLLGLHQTMDGTPFKTLVVLSCMPSAFLALVPPVLYGLDLDLANSGWLASTLALLAILPLLFLLVA